jgi:peptidoglycan/xylan/chitin deacetylase (PgdA/CDA1 family)
MRCDGGSELTVGPAALYLAKATATRLRSVAWAARRLAPQDGVRILFYHRVSDDDDELAVRPGRFRAHMAALAEAGFRAVDVATAAGLLRRGEPAKWTVGLSFDDGYRDVVENAAPVLAEHEFRASVFVSTGVVDGRVRFSWYDRQPPVLSWDEIGGHDGKQLVFEPHTITHPNLLAVDDATAANEIAGSKRALEERLGRRVSVFCYPAGLFGEREKRLVREAGYEAATSCEPGVNTAATDPFALRRIQVDRRDSLLDFRAKVGGAHDRALPLRGLYRRRTYGARS